MIEADTNPLRDKTTETSICCAYLCVVFLFAFVIGLKGSLIPENTAWKLVDRLQLGKRYKEIVIWTLVSIICVRNLVITIRTLLISECINGS